jgi:hypothetical protein
VRKRTWALVAAALAAGGCDRTADVASGPCLRVLERRLPEAEVLRVKAEAGRASVAFQVGDWGDRVKGVLACAVEPVGTAGGWRVREATLDGVALTAAELAVVNAELFLADLGRAGAAAE